MLHSELDSGCEMIISSASSVKGHDGKVLIVRAPCIVSQLPKFEVTYSVAIVFCSKYINGWEELTTDAENLYFCKKKC